MRLWKCAIKRPDTHLHIRFKAFLRETAGQTKGFDCRKFSDNYAEVPLPEYYQTLQSPRRPCSLAESRSQGRHALQAVCLLLLIEFRSKLFFPAMLRRHTGPRRYQCKSRITGIPVLRTAVSKISPSTSYPRACFALRMMRVRASEISLRF